MLIEIRGILGKMASRWHHPIAWCYFSSWCCHFEVKKSTYLKKWRQDTQPHNLIAFSLEVPLFCSRTPRKCGTHILRLFSNRQWIFYLFFYASTWYTTSGNIRTPIERDFAVGGELFVGSSSLTSNLRASCYLFNICNVLPLLVVCNLSTYFLWPDLDALTFKL